MTALITAVATLLADLAPVLVNAVNDRYESLDAAKTDVVSAVDKFTSNLNNLLAIELADDAAANAAAAQK